MTGGPVVGHVARSVLAFNALGAAPVLKIHPAIGIARVGDSPAGFFIGPELPLSPATGQADGVGSPAPPYRDGGKIKRQAARFRVYSYATGSDPEELNLDHPEVAEIEWTVHLANRKAAFFKFDGQQGAAGPFAAPPPKGRRNPSVAVVDREKSLVIDPGPRKIKGAKAGPVAINASSGGNWPKNLGGVPVISELGELRTDSKGRLLVLGGRGKSVSSNALKPDARQMTEIHATGFPGGALDPARPQAPLLEYANNDTWFDDVSDGPVTATVKLKSGRVLTVKFPAWVMAAPPDFAPAIRSVVSLYDAMLDVAVRDLPAPVDLFYTPTALARYVALKTSFAAGLASAGFLADFALDIEPTIRAGLDARFVHEPVSGSHGTLEVSDLKNPAASAASMRKFVFDFMRPPAGNKTYSGSHSMPKLFGDNYDITGDPGQVLAVTKLQTHLLRLWKDGSFTAGAAPAGPVTPQGLDRAALENCVGGAFFPGIECSWLVRSKAAYLEPFRIKLGAAVGTLTVGPGFFSQQMALPWQADFLDCAKDSALGTPFGWWPAQRPDNVYLKDTDAAAQTNMVSWTRDLMVGITPPFRPGTAHATMVLRWNKLGFVVPTVIAGNTVFIEKP